jgi:hypothetical protein
MSVTYSIGARPRVQPPPTISEVQSWSFIIRDMFFDRLMISPFFANFTARKSRALQIQTSSIPYLGVYFVNEDMTPDGDLNAGEIRFTHLLKIGFSVIIQNNDIVACETKLDQAYWAIMNTLWRDPNLTNLIDTRAYPGGIGNPDNTRIEGVSRGTRRHVFGNAGLNNETPIGEMQYEATVKYSADYGPIVLDNLLLIHQELAPLKADDTVPPADEVQRIITEYDFTSTFPPAPQPLEEKEDDHG